jgi:hypothetical protein
VEGISVWERIRFKDGHAVTWERSYDEGKTWKPVEHHYEHPPFILFNPSAEVQEMIRVIYE